MRFLHTGDWHVGKTIRGRSRDDEFAAVLAEVAAIARDERVDCVLVAGDVFDSAAPAPEAERLVFEFFRELVSSRIPAVVIGGNHDHPKRLEAAARVLELIAVHLRGEAVRPESGGIVEIAARDGERARVAVLPWVPERKVVAFEEMAGAGNVAQQTYADRVADLMEWLAREFRPDAVNVLLAHVLVDSAVVGAGGGERELHLGDTFAVKAQRLPRTAQYIALGHVHRPQLVAGLPARYAGSLLQLDFGETQQQKAVVLVEASPGLPAQVREVPLRSGRRLSDLAGTPADLERLVDGCGDDYLRVTVHLPGPTPGISARVRELLPNTVEVRTVLPATAGPDGNGRGPLGGLGPVEMFERYCAAAKGGQADPAIMALFRRLYEEAQHAAVAP